MQNPFTIFGQWFELAKKSGMLEPTAMNLATSTKDGKPSSRVVLLKSFDEKGFVFYTNAESRKGGELISNPNAALNFYWMDMQRQIRIEGKVEKVEGEEADNYYNSRHLEKRLGAWASQQSQVLEKPGDLKKRIEEMRIKFGENPPRPPFWHGFRIVPSRFEFWQEGEFRLHQRDIYERQGESWEHSTLYP